MTLEGAIPSTGTNLVDTTATQITSILIMNKKYSDLQIKEAVASSLSWAQVCRKLRGINDKNAILTGMQSHIRNRAAKSGCDISHFTGQAWNKGKSIGPKRKLSEFLCKDGPFIKSNDLKKRLIREGIMNHECQICKLSKWNDSHIPLELDHINGDHFDNRLDNLRVICPNCHAQTETYCSRNIKK